MKLLHLATLVLMTATVATTQTPAPPIAPLPTALSIAHKIFIGNAGDQENADCLRAYNVFYAGIQGLKNYQLVLDPNQADIVLELHYEIGFGASVNSGQAAPRQFRVVIEDPKSRIILWSLTERTNYAVFQKNRDKNLDETMAALINDFSLLTSPQPIAPNNRSVIHH